METAVTYIVTSFTANRQLPAGALLHFFELPFRDPRVQTMISIQTGYLELP